MPEGTEAPHTARSLARATSVTGLVSLVCRIAGLARDVMLARIFGDSALGSSFAAGFLIPNTFRRLFAEGALSAAFIPEYADARRHEPREAPAYARWILARLAVVTGVVTVVIELVLLLLLWLLPHHADRTLSLRLIMIMLPFMPGICIAGLLAGMLQVHGRFAWAATGPLVLNGLIIGVGIWHLSMGTGGDRTTAYLLGAATVLSGVGQASFFARLLGPALKRPADPPDVRPRGRRTLRRLVPVMVGLGSVQLSTLLDAAIAMWPIWVGPTILGFVHPLDERSNVILSLTARLYQFPLGVFGIAVAAAVFPMLSRVAREPGEFHRVLRRGVRLSLFIALPATAGLLLIRHDLVAVVYSGGSRGFTADGVERAAAVVAGYGAGVWAYSLNHVLVRGFYARGDMRTPMRISLAMIGFNMALNLGLIWFLREAGMAWGTAITGLAQTVLLTWLTRRAPDGAPVLDAATRAAFVRTIAASAAMGLAVWAVGRNGWSGTPGWGEKALRVAAMTATGLGSYVIAARLLGCAELRWLLPARGRGDAR